MRQAIEWHVRLRDLRPSLRGPKLFLARDHFGVKPFYYAQQGDRFAFASEIKALLQVPGIDAELDLEPCTST